MTIYSINILNQDIGIPHLQQKAWWSSSWMSSPPHLCSWFPSPGPMPLGSAMSPAVAAAQKSSRLPSTATCRRKIPCPWDPVGAGAARSEAQSMSTELASGIWEVKQRETLSWTWFGYLAKKSATRTRLIMQQFVCVMCTQTWVKLHVVQQWKEIKLIFLQVLVNHYKYEIAIPWKKKSC